MSIYFVLHEGTGHVKIGYSDSVKKRISQLQTGNPEKLRLLRVIDGGPKTEQWLHKRFSGFNVRGEWFAFHDEMLSVVPPDFVGKTSPPPQKKESIGCPFKEARNLGLITDAEWANLSRAFS